MWPAKLPGEGAALFDACAAMCDAMKELGIAIDGGKDSLSMAARVGTETVRAPGENCVYIWHSLFMFKGHSSGSLLHMFNYLCIFQG